jgi:hypothetical protein
MNSTPINSPVALDSVLCDLQETDDHKGVSRQCHALQDNLEVAIRIEETVDFNDFSIGPSDTNVNTTRCFEWLRTNSLPLYACSLVIFGAIGIIIAKVGTDYAFPQLQTAGLSIFCLTVIGGSVAKIAL